MTTPTITPEVTPDASKAHDASVLNGVSGTHAETPAAPKPKPRAPRKPATPKAVKPETPVQTAKRNAKTAAKAPAKPKTAKAPAPKPEVAKADPKPETNGDGPSRRESKQDLAKKVVDLVTSHFADASDDDKDRIAYFLSRCPTPLEDGTRYWPAGFPAPKTAGAWPKR